MHTQLTKLWEEGRSSLWFLPSILVTASAVLAFVLVGLEGIVGEKALRLLPLVFGAGPDGSRGMLTAIAGSVLGLAGITFSSTLVALSIAASTYTPRILRNFLRDRGNQTVLGTILGTFVYCILVLRTIRAGESEFVPTLAVTAAILLALVDLGLFIYFVNHIAQSIQATTITASIANDTKRAIDTVFPERLHGAEVENDAEPERVSSGQTVPTPRSGYIQIVDHEQTLEFALRHNLMLQMERGVGDFVAEGAPLVTLIARDRVEDDAVRDLQQLYGISKERSVRQDVEFGFRQLVDIAIKALSPGVNDVTTAVTCIDHLGDLLRYTGDRRMSAHHRRDENGRLRVIARTPTYSDLVGIAFDQIRVAGQSQVAIMLRQIGVIEHLAIAIRPPDRRRALLDHLNLIGAAADRGLSDEADRQRVAQALDRVGAELRDVGVVRTL